MLQSAILNASMRMLTLLAKFALTVFIAKKLSPTALGIHTLLVGAVGLAAFAVGMEFYIFAAREILTRERSKVATLLKGQIMLHTALYVTVLVLATASAIAGLVQAQYVIWFAVFTATEVAFQEAHRLLIAFEKPLLSNVLLFFKGGLWVYILIAVALLGHDITLGEIWGCWVTFTIFAMLMASIAIGRLVHWRELLAAAVDLEWLMHGLRVTILFFISSLALRYVKYIDKLILQITYGESIVGIYSFYSNITVAMEAFVMSGLIIVLYPKLIKTYNNNSYLQFYDILKKLNISIWLISSLLAALFYLLIPYVLKFIDKTQYINNVTLALPLIVAAFLYNISLTYHYALYAMRRDKAIMYSSLIYSAVATLFIALLAPRFGAIGAAWGTALSAAIHLAIKYAWFAVVWSSSTRGGSL